MNIPAVSPSSSPLNPTYWGSFLALIVGLVLNIVSYLLHGLPSHMDTTPHETRSFVFAAVCLMVFLLATRYFLLVHLNIYGEAEVGLLSLNTALRRIIFGMIVGLTLLSLLSSSATIAIGLHVSLLTCVAMSAVAFLAGGACWILSQTNNWSPVNTIFIFADLLFFILSLLALLVIDRNLTEEIQTILPILLFILLALFGNEVRKYYAPLLSKNLRRVILELM